MVQNTTSSRRRSPYGHAAVTRPRNTTTKPPLPADTVSRRTSVSTVKTKQSKQSKLTKKSTEKRDPPEAITNNKCGGRKKALGKSVTIKAPKTPARGKNYKGSDSKASGSTITTREDNSNTAFDEFSNTYDPFDPQQHHQYHQETHSGVGSRRTRVRPEVKGVKILSDDPTAIEMVEECINDIDFPGIQAFVAKGAGAMLACFANDVKAISGKTITAGGDCVANAPPLPNGGNCTTTKEILVLPVAECGAPAVDPKQEPYQKLVGKDLWSFYRAVCGSMTVKWKYDDAFRKLKDDPLYPYLNSCSGVNDISGEGQKRLVQVCTPGAVYSSLANKAKDSQPQLVEICKTLAKKLKLTKIGVGPIKEEAAAKAKAERKYGCNLCNITDYCRAFVVVEDIATLLALLEYVCENLGSSICRIKLSSLKDSPLPGGYRDCKINLMVRGHICEIQVHLFYLYSVCDVDGYQHYQECLQNDINAFNNDPFNVLNGYDQKTLGEIAQIAEKTIRVTSVDNISWENEEKIVDYFAIAGLLLHHEESFKAEVILRKLINLRTAKDQTPRMESNHPEVNHLKKALEKTLRQQNLVEEADLIADHRVEGEGQENATDAGSVSSASFFGSIAFDHNHKKRTDDEKKQKEKEAKLSRKQWTKIRQQRFSIISSYSVAQIALADINEQLNSFSGGGPPKTGSGTRRTRASPNPPVMRSSKGLKGS